MTSLLATRRRAEEFARLVDEQRHTHDPKLAHLVAVTARLNPATVEPSAQFRTALRDRLVAAASEADTASAASATTVATITESAAASPPQLPRRPQPRPLRTPPPARRLRWLAITTSVVIASGMVGTAAASRTAMPGDGLYDLKLGLERTETAIATNDQSQGRAYLTQAERRLAEATTLAGGSRVSTSDDETIGLINAALEDFVRHSQDGAQLLFGVYAEEERRGVLDSLGSFTAESLVELERVEEFLADPSLEAHGHATEVLRGFENRLLVLCPGCLALPEEADSAGDWQAGAPPVEEETTEHGGHTADESEELVASDVGPETEKTEDQATSEDAAPDRRPGQEPSPDGSEPRDPHQPPRPDRTEPETSDLPLPVPDVPELPDQPDPAPRGPSDRPGPEPTSPPDAPTPEPAPTPGDEADAEDALLPLGLPSPLPPLELPLELPWSGSQSDESEADAEEDGSVKTDAPDGGPSPDGFSGNRPGEARQSTTAEPTTPQSSTPQPSRAEDPQAPSPASPEDSHDGPDTAPPSPGPTPTGATGNPDPSTDPTQTPTRSPSTNGESSPAPNLPLPTGPLGPN